ncbi:MAG TPA: hypothetical protein G4N94_11190 [Caldilineae bacterium]|nr:hypothetical protein [Caldilineae bacterium]
MKRQLFPLLLSLMLLTLLLGACVSSLPANTPVVPTTPVSSSGAVAKTTIPHTPTETIVPQETRAPSAQNDAKQPVLQTTPVFVAEASPPPAPIPTPTLTLPSILEPPAARDLALAFLRGAYQVKLPDSADFEPAVINQDVASDVTSVAAFSSGPWLVSLGDAQFQEGGVTRPVIISNDSTGASWRGQIDGQGIVSTLLAVGLPTYEPQRVRGWVGQIVKLSAESPYDDYFFSERRGSHGIDSLDPAVLAELERYQDQPGLVKVSGVLLYGVDDYNGRQLLINQIEHRAGPTPPPLPESAEHSAPTVDLATPTPFFGPTGALTNGLPGSILRDHVYVQGQAEAVFENKVIVQIEDEEGEVLGRGIAPLSPAENSTGGTFAVEVAFENQASARGGRVALYAENPSDGSLLLLSWANIRFAESGKGQVAILAPVEGEIIKRTVLVQGVAADLPNSEVLVQVEDHTGTIWGKAKTQTNDAGEWSKTIKFRRPPTARTGRIAIYEINPIDNSMTLLAVQEVRLLE